VKIGWLEHVRCGGEMYTAVWWGNPNSRDVLVNLGVDGKYGWAWTGLKWHRDCINVS